VFTIFSLCPSLARRRSRAGLLTLVALVLACPPCCAQQTRGELRLEIRDPQGVPVRATAELISQANQYRREFAVPADTNFAIHNLLFGIYQLTLTAPGFASWSRIVEIPSEVPVRITAVLGVAPVNSQVEVQSSATLLDAERAGIAYSVGRQTISEQQSAQPARELLNVVADQPGFLFEANGVLHPRGSEYDVQFVVDGLPLTENRSPAFSPAIDFDDVESMRILTAGYPAEYGRKLGGIVEVTTQKNLPLGWHGALEAEGGSFSTAAESAAISYAGSADRFSASGYGFHSARYLDPPVLANLTNRANAYGFSVSYERDLTSRDRLRINLQRSDFRFLVPNELMQQAAGQRQDRDNFETSGQLFYQHTISSDLLFSALGSVRDSGATLSSNSNSTPITVSQSRGYREGYARADLAGHHRIHDWKTGVDAIFNPVHEQLAYTITDFSFFDPGACPSCAFAAQRWDIETSAYAQDEIHLHHWNLSAGLRFDHYRFVVSESALSPRVGISRFIPQLNLLLHASYDRAFQTAALENLLLASSPEVQSFNATVLRLPVRPSRGNFYEGGLTKAFFGKLRLDATVFRRDFRQFADDDVLLNTGISFPIAFAKARIFGVEARAEIPQWGPFSGFVSYSNQAGYGVGPVTGGLFLGSDAANALALTGKFADSQDQRNTLRSHIRVQLPRRAWFAFGGAYGSGLPADTGDADTQVLLQNYGAAVLSKVNLDRGRVRPSFALDFAAGAELYHKEARSLSCQFQLANLFDRLNVINFASLFSGSAIAPPRSASARLRFAF
jgi:TonB dependent receptor/TonB-dependent Receptor Plug Domain